MKSSWQHFLYSVIAQLVLPLMPLFVEFWLTGKIDEKTFAIATAMYAISVGVATKNLATLGVSIAVACSFSSVYGYLEAGHSPHFKTTIPAILTMFAFMVTHAAERYRRHVLSSEPFIDFGKNDN